MLEDFSAYVTDSTKSKKDTNVIMNELLLDIFMHVNGEKHCVLVFDCGRFEGTPPTPPFSHHSHFSHVPPPLRSRLGADVGPLNHNGAITFAFAQLLVDIGLFDTVQIVFLQLHHSKVPTLVGLGRWNYLK